MKQTEISERMKYALKIRGMKQTELADKTGIDKGQISSYLSGKYNPKQENLSLIAEVLGVNDYWLRGLDVPIERTVSNAADQQRRLQAYTKEVYEMRGSKKVLRMYSELSEENRIKVRTYMERLLAVQRMEEQEG